MKESNNEYSIYVSEVFPLACGLCVLVFATIRSLYLKKFALASFIIVTIAALLYGANLTYAEEIARESSYFGISMVDLDPCVVPVDRFFIFNISKALAVKCEVYDHFVLNEDVDVEKRMAKWALHFYDIYVENIAFSNLVNLCQSKSISAEDYAFFNCSRRLIAPETVPEFLLDANRFLPGNCQLTAPEPVPMYNMRYTVANCPMRYMRPYVFTISVTALFFSFLYSFVADKFFNS